MKKKIIIIGGVAGGATAATRLRRLSEEDEIILVEKGAYISFANCGLPYHIGGVIKERDELLLQTPEAMEAQYGLDVRPFSEVIAIDPTKKEVRIFNHQTNEHYDESFDKLIISTGAKAIVPTIEGLSESENVFTLRNIPDMDQIKDFISKNNVQTATVIGAGFIGLEMTENLIHLGINVQLVEMASQVMSTVDFELAQMLHAQIEMHNVKLVLGEGLKAFQNEGHQILLSSGAKLSTDMTILTIGVTPESTLAKKAGIEIGFKGGIKVNEKLETSAHDIYAIGDVIATTDTILNHETNIPLASPANRQGRLVADIINGYPITYPGIQGTAVAKIFELTVASTGLNTQRLDRLQIEYNVIHIHPNSHAGYYPGTSPISMKLIFASNGKILGAQAVGSDGVEKRIDVIATAMKLGAKAQDLAELELSYAPPFSSAKDPVNLLGYTADNMITGKVKTFQYYEVQTLKKNNAFFLDVREDFELATGKIEGSFQIPLHQLRNRLKELPRDKTIYVYCQVGQRGYNAARILMQAGYNVYNLDGGFKTYKIANYQSRVIEFKSKSPIPTDFQQFQEFQTEIIEVDACGLQCPGPILKVKENIDKMKNGQKLKIEASDFGFSTDIEAWCKNTGNTLVDNEIKDNKVFATILKGNEQSNPSSTSIPTNIEYKEGVLQETKDGTTMVLFSGDFDKAIASMIIATGAASFGKNVTIFCTFWGLNLLKKQKKVKKHGIAKMFDLMLPKSANAMPLSKMNMGGLGTKMIQSIMKEKNVDALPLMIERAHEMGVNFIACTMSMDLMGIEKDELFDWVEFGGVASFIGASENANMQLFI